MIINSTMTEIEINKVIFGEAAVYELVAMPIEIACELIKPEYYYISSHLRNWAWATIDCDLIKNQ